MGLYLLLILLCFSQVSSEPYTPKVPQRCDNPQTEHYVETINKCCRSCPPGKRFLRGTERSWARGRYFAFPRAHFDGFRIPLAGSRVQRRCNESTDTRCVDCEEGMYTPAWSRAERCFSCVPPCKAGFVEVKECTRTQDRFCWCRSHQFCKIKLSQSCLQCAEHRPCAKGSGVVKPGTGSSDVQCAPCDAGTFSDVESATALCKPHKNCKSILVPGNSTDDAVCSDPNDGPVDAATHSPPDPVTTQRNTKLPPPLSVTGDPTLDVKQDASGDVSSLAGWLAGVAFLGVALIAAALLCLAFRKKDQDCALPCAKEKQPSTEKGFWIQDAGALGPEEQNLLQVSVSSSSGSLENPAGSDESRLHLERPGATRVDVSCVVRVRGSDGFRPADGSRATHPGPSAGDDDLPFPKEESPEEGEGTGTRVAVEVEDVAEDAGTKAA